MTANTVMAGLDFIRLTNSITDRIVAGTPGIRTTKEMVIDYVEHRDFAEMINLIHDSFLDHLH